MDDIELAREIRRVVANAGLTDSNLVAALRILFDRQQRERAEMIDFDQYISWADQQIDWPNNGQWCPRHWAPCPVDGYNGVGASVEIMRTWAQAQPTITPEELNIAMRETIGIFGAICCALGDTVMSQVWENWPPTAQLPGQVEVRPSEQ
jgi:hypothetical protein